MTGPGLFLPARAAGGVRELTHDATRVMALLLLAALWQSVFWLQGVPVATKAALVAITALSCMRPADALLLVAGLAPLGGPAAALAGMTAGRGPEAIVLAFLVGWFGRAAVRRETLWHPGDSLRPPVLFLTATVVASFAVSQVVSASTASQASSLWREMSWLAVSSYLADLNPPLHDLYAAVQLIEGLLLLTVTIRLTRLTPGLGHRLIRMLVAGAIAGAILSCVRLAMGTLRAPDAAAFLLTALRTIRLSFHVGDVNAAGSHFAMVALMLVGLALSARRGRWAWSAAVPVVVAGLWLTGSRSAVAGAVCAIAVVGVVTAILRGVAWGRTALATGAAVAAGAAALFLLPQMVGGTTGRVVAIRWYFLETSWRIWQTAPTWGVGIGRYLEKSAIFMPPELRQIYTIENAHNQFAQVGVELGVVGLTLFLWVLAAAGCRAWKGMLASRGDPTLVWSAGGVLAFLLSSLAGHPLLVGAVATAFWITAGTVVALGDEQCATVPVSARPVAQESGRWQGLRSWGVPLGATALLLTVPLRIPAALNAVDWEDVKYGFSLAWQHDAEAARRYRVAGPKASFFIAAETQVVVLPLGGPESDRPIVVEIRIDGRLANRVRMQDRTWREFDMLMPSGGEAGRFRRIDLTVTDGADGPAPAPDDEPGAPGPRVRVGEIAVRPPRATAR